MTILGIDISWCIFLLEFFCGSYFVGLKMCDITAFFVGILVSVTCWKGLANIIDKFLTNSSKNNFFN